MSAADAIGADGVIFHVGSHLGRGFDAAMEQIVPALDVVLGERDAHDQTPWLLIENAAGHEGTMGVSSRSSSRSWTRSAGPSGSASASTRATCSPPGYDIRTPEDVDALLDEVDERIGLDRLRCLHVNDSKMPFDSHRDRHENVGDGAIGGNMASILGSPRLQDLPAVMETPGPDGHGPDDGDMKTLRRLHRNGCQAVGEADVVEIGAARAIPLAELLVPLHAAAAARAASTSTRPARGSSCCSTWRARPA